MSEAWRGKKPTVRALEQRIRGELGIPEGEHGRWVRDGYGLHVWIRLRQVLEHIGLRGGGDRWRLVPLLLTVLGDVETLVERSSHGRRIYRGRVIEIVVKHSARAPRGWHFVTLYRTQRKGGP